MTFSEYITRHAYYSYLEYCRQNYLKPEVDIDVNKPKLCALVKSPVDKSG
jgi:hypothetical protein